MQLQNKSIENNEQAFDYLKKELQKNDWHIIYESKENNNRDLFIATTNSKTTQRYYCKYHREYYLNYGHEFAMQGEKGFGESINQKTLFQAIALKTDKIIFIYKNTETKYCYPQQILKYAETHQTIRQQKKGETTYSFPINLLQEFQQKESK